MVVNGYADYVFCEYFHENSKFHVFARHMGPSLILLQNSLVLGPPFFFHSITN